MILYAESSAVLAWLLDEDAGAEIRALLADASVIVASDLTLIESDRVLLRAAALRELSEGDAAGLRAHLVKTAAQWHVLRVSSEVVTRARRPFPSEPLRTLDAIHLATALTARAVLPGLEMLTMDDRVRRAAASVGLRVRPV